MALLLALTQTGHAQMCLQRNSSPASNTPFDPVGSGFNLNFAGDLAQTWITPHDASTASGENPQQQGSDNNPPPAPSQPGPQLTPPSWKSLPIDVLHDQEQIWASPTKIRGKQMKWFIPFAAATASLLVIDERSSRRLNNYPGLQNTSNNISIIGNGYSCVALAGSISLLGELTHNDHTTETGLLSLEALADSGILVEGLKLMAERSRPSANNGEGQFWSGGSSFPSGHAITTFAIASVIAQEYPDNPWVRYGALGWATAVSLSRIGGRQHFPSDVLVGATFGYLIGRYVTHHPYSQSGKNGHTLSVLPSFSPLNGGYGLSVSLGF